MTRDESRETVTDADVTTFSQKLHTWAEGLAPAEQALLQRLITRAAAAGPEPEDTQGYIIIVGGLSDRNFVLEGTRPSPVLMRAIGVSEISIVKYIDKSTPG